MSQRNLSGDREEIRRFTEALFRYADENTYVSLRAFDQFRRDVPPKFIRPFKINGDLCPLIDRALEGADQCAIADHSIVFAPPICTFTNPGHAGNGDLANGLTLSVELDEGDTLAARRKLESLLGPATVVVASGGEWTDPETGEVHPKQHLHWRLNEPTRAPDDHDKLRQARGLAARLTGADPTGKPVVHPLRWPGSWNTKIKPRLARIVALNEGAEIDLNEALEALEEAASAAGLDAAGIPKSADPQADPELLNTAMQAIPNSRTEVHYSDWIRLGYACFRAYGGDAGFDTWETWSKLSDKYDARETEAAWQRIANAINGSSVPRTIGAGTIFFLAKQAGWERPKPEPKEKRQQNPQEQPASHLFDPWGDMLPPKWPGNILKPEYEATIAELAHRDGCDFGVLAMAFIGAVSGAADKSMRFEPYQHAGFKVPPIVYLMPIADSGFRKSAITSTAFRAIERRDQEEWRDHQARIRDWEASGADDRIKPKPPTPRIFENATTEVIQAVVSRSERGAMLLRDELAPLFDFQKYSRGKGAEERALLLNAYDGKRSRVHRMGRDTDHGDVSLSIFGACQPDRLADFHDLGSDGLLQRIQPLVIPERLLSQPGTMVHAQDKLDQAIDALMTEQGHLVYRTTPEGSTMIRETEVAAHDLAEAADFGKSFQGYAGKLNGLHARLAFLLHLLDAQKTATIPLETIEKAKRLTWFCVGHAMAFYSRAPGTLLDITRAAAGYILGRPEPPNGEEERMLASAFTGGVRSCRGMTLKRLGDVLAPLIAGGWLMPEKSTPDCNAWIVTAGIRRAFAQRKEAEDTRCKAVRELILEAAAGREPRKRRSG